MEKETEKYKKYPNVEWLKLKEDMEFWHVPGAAVSIALDGEILLSAGEGTLMVGGQTEVSEDTLFCIASCTKSFTTSLAYMLSKEGLFDFDEPITKYIPELRFKDKIAEQELTLRDMFSHVSGMPGHDFLWPYYDISESEFIKRIAGLDFSEPFRSKAQYNNLMYILAGIAEERVAHKKWGDLIKEYIFEPLGLTESFLSIEEATKMAPDRIAHGYIYVDGAYKELTSIAPKERASGSLVMSVHDLMIWLQFQLDGKAKDGSQLLDEAELEFLHTPLVIYGEKNHGFEKDSIPILYGLGWFIREYRGMRLVYHHGGTLGYNSLQAIIPSKKFAMSILINSHGIAEMFTDAVLFAVIDYLFFGEDTINLWRSEYHTDADKTNHFIDRTGDVVITEMQHGKESIDLAGQYYNDSYGTIMIKSNETGMNLRFKDFDVPLEYMGESSEGTVFVIDSLIADTEFYKLPVTYIAEKCEIIIPFEGKTKSIRFAKVV